MFEPHSADHSFHGSDAATRIAAGYRACGPALDLQSGLAAAGTANDRITERGDEAGTSSATSAFPVEVSALGDQFGTAAGRR